MMMFPTHVTMNTYATSARFCAYADRSCNNVTWTFKETAIKAKIKA